MNFTQPTVNENHEVVNSVNVVPKIVCSLNDAGDGELVHIIGSPPYLGHIVKVEGSIHYGIEHILNFPIQLTIDSVKHLIKVVNHASQANPCDVIRIAGDQSMSVYAVYPLPDDGRAMQFIGNDYPQQHPADLWPLDEAFEMEMEIFALEMHEVPFAQADYIS